MTTLVLIITFLILAGNTATAQEVKVRVGDLLHITVRSEPDLSGTFAVNADGKIAFPLLGEIDVSGTSSAEVATQIRRMLEKDYLKDAIVSVRVAGGNSYKKITSWTHDLDRLKGTYRHPTEPKKPYPIKKRLTPQVPQQ